MPTKDSVGEQQLFSIERDPTLTEIRAEVYRALVTKGVAEAFRSIAHIFFHTQLAECSLYMNQMFLRRVWGHVERRATQRARDITEEAIDLVEVAIDAEWGEHNSEAPAKAIGCAQTDIVEELRRAYTLGRASAFIELLCTGDYFTEKAFLYFATKLS